MTFSPTSFQASQILCLQLTPQNLLPDFPGYMTILLFHFDNPWLLATKPTFQKHHWVAYAPSATTPDFKLTLRFSFLKVLVLRSPWE